MFRFAVYQKAELEIWLEPDKCRYLIVDGDFHTSYQPTDMNGIQTLAHLIADRDESKTTIEQWGQMLGAYAISNACFIH